MDDCAEEIGKITNQFKIKGVMPDNLMKAGEAMGLKFEEIPSFQGRSIFWAGSVLIKMSPCQYLVTIPRHYVALEVRDSSLYICDNHTQSEIELQNSARLSQKIERVWKVTRVKAYSKPHIVKSEYAVERDGMHVSIKIIHTLSDDGIKIVPLGAFNIMSPGGIQEVAFKLMELSDQL